MFLRANERRAFVETVVAGRELLLGDLTYRNWISSPCVHPLMYRTLQTPLGAIKKMGN